MPIKLKKGLKYVQSYVFWVLTVIFSVFFLSAFQNDAPEQTASENLKQIFLTDCKKLSKLASAFTSSLEDYRLGKILGEEITTHFFELKRSYKRVEYFIEYLDPDLAKALNGPPLAHVAVEHQPYLALKYVEPVFEIRPPEGLQVMEELIFNEEDSLENQNKLLPLAYLFEERVMLFTNGITGKYFSDNQFLESFRDQLIRVMALSIAGFDTPVAGPDLAYALISIEPILEGVELYQIGPHEKIRDQSKLAAGFLKKSIDFLRANTDFDAFDRLYFIRELIDPAYGHLTVLHRNYLRNSSNLFFERPVNEDAMSIFSNNFLRPGFFSKQDQVLSDDHLYQLGKILFFDPILSANNERSCASCHNPSKAFTDGRKKSLAFDFSGEVKRNSPTLINAIFSTAFFMDARVEYLQDQVPEVITNEDELHGTYEDVVQKLLESPEYKNLFNKAFDSPAKSEININMINRSIAAYLQRTVALNSDFDRYMRKETDSLNVEAKRGFNLFMGKANCGTCHFAPIFNGTVPPRFIETETEVLGVPWTADLSKPVIDPDSGRAAIIKADVFLHSFKTPTVRNANLTAPYMHNGVFDTLEEVMEFYDRGGGVGLGMVVPNQTLPAEPLNLTSEEKKDLIEFMISLTDTTNTTSIPLQLPNFPDNPKLNKRIIGGSY